MILTFYSKMKLTVNRSKSTFVKMGNEKTDKFFSQNHQQVTEMNPSIKIHLSNVNCQKMP